MLSQYTNFHEALLLPKMTPFRPSFSDLCGQKMVIFDQKWIFKTENNYLFQSLLTLLGQTADELLSRQIKWVKQLPFFEELQIPDYTTLISNTWWVQFLRFSWLLEKSFFENLFFFGKILHFLKFQSANILFRAESMLLAALTTHRDVIFDQLGEITDRFKPSDEEFAR